jgi:hypothetical protein
LFVCCCRCFFLKKKEISVTETLAFFNFFQKRRELISATGEPTPDPEYPYTIIPKYGRCRDKRACAAAQDQATAVVQENVAVPGGSGISFRDTEPAD